LGDLDTDGRIIIKRDYRKKNIGGGGGGVELIFLAQDREERRVIIKAMPKSFSQTAINS
jgi:hypothetical protein